MTIDKQSFPFPLHAAFIAILEKEIAKAEPPSGAGVILNFRDPGYSSEAGGFHPVEISVNGRGQIQYITDFSFVGQSPYDELAKEIDFDISLGVFQHFGREFPLHTGRELYVVWQENFVSYFAMGVFQVTASEG